MKGNVEWYRSDAGERARDAVPPSVSRRIRHWLRDRLPEPDVRGKTMVMYARQGFRKLSAWAGMFSEFHSVLGALAYAEMQGAAGVRVDFRSPLYLDPGRGPNWWTYFFESACMRVDPHAANPTEVHLNQVVSKFGKHGGFCDVVNGPTPYLYPMTYGIGRGALNHLLTLHVRVRPEITEEVQRVVAASFEPGAYVIGVHYRGTDSTRRWTHALLDYRTYRIPYRAYADEVRAALQAAAPARFQIFVATDETEFLDFMRHEFEDRVVYTNAPRVRANGRAIHFDDSLPVSKYDKGKSGLVDSLLLANTSYLIKGRSNLSDASLAFNPRLPYSFCVH